jgi:hypothetical protein
MRHEWVPEQGEVVAEQRPHKVRQDSPMLKAIDHNGPAQAAGVAAPVG